MQSFRIIVAVDYAAVADEIDLINMSVVQTTGDGLPMSFDYQDGESVAVAAVVDWQIVGCGCNGYKRASQFGCRLMTLHVACTLCVTVIDELANGRPQTTVGSAMSDVSNGTTEEHGVVLNQLDRPSESKRLNDAPRYGSKSGGSSLESATLLLLGIGIDVDVDDDAATAPGAGSNPVPGVRWSFMLQLILSQSYALGSLLPGETCDVAVECQAEGPCEWPVKPTVDLKGQVELPCEETKVARRVCGCQAEVYPMDGIMSIGEVTGSNEDVLSTSRIQDGMDYMACIVDAGASQQLVSSQSAVQASD